MKALVRTAMLLVCVTALIGCKSVQYVPVEHTHTEYIHTVDSVLQVDSFYVEKETIIMQVDSQAMAEFGVQLQGTERAWLIRTRELERKLEQLMKAKKDTIILRDTIPQPYPVEVQVERRLTWWQQTRLHIANIVLIALAICAAHWLISRRW